MSTFFADPLWMRLLVDLPRFDKVNKPDATFFQARNALNGKIMLLCVEADRLFEGTVRQGEVSW